MTRSRGGNWGGVTRAPRYLVAALLLWVSIPVARADFRFDHLGVSEGLSQSRATAMAEGSEGRMWIGTESGLNLYDGYSFESLRTDNASNDWPLLITGRISGLFGGRPGQIWVASGDGVAVVDLNAESVKTARHSNLFPGIATSQGDKNAKFLAPCDEGIWLVRSRAVFYVAESAEALSEKVMMTTRLPDEFELSFSGFSAIVDEHNTLWVADHHRLWRIECGQSQLTLVARRDQAAHSPVPGGSALTLSADGQLFWASRQQLDVLSIEAEVFDTTRTQVAFRAPQGQINGIARDSTGSVWVSTTQGLGRLSANSNGPLGADWALVPVYQASATERGESITDRVGLEMVTSGDGLVWTHSSHGVIVLNPARNQAFRLEHDPSRPRSLPPIREGQVVMMRADRFGGVWLAGGLGGISRYVPEKNRFGVVENVNPFSQSARSFEAVGLGGDSYLWTGWDGGQLNLWQLGPANDFERVAEFPAKGGPGAIRGQRTIRAMAETRQGRVWMASSSYLWLADTENRQRELMHVFEDYANTGDEAVYANIGLIYDESASALIFSHESDLWRIQLDENDVIESVERLDWVNRTLDQQAPKPPGFIGQTSLLHLHSGHYLVGTSAGVRWLDLSTQRVIDHRLTRPDIDGASGSGVNVIAMAQSPDGAVWLATRRGLARLELATDGQSIQSLAWWDADDGLPDNTVYAVAAVDSLRVWISTNRGLSHLEWSGGFDGPPKLSHPSVAEYRAIEGLPAYEFNSRAVDQDNQGRLYFGSVGGVAWFNPSTIRAHPMPPEVQLLSARVNDEPTGLAGSDEVITLGHRDNNLVLEYAGIHFAASDQNRFAYQLEGHEPDWVMAGSVREARYANLPPGDYRFWVRAANLDGVWSEPQLLLQAKINPPPWATPWAYVAYGLMVLGLILLLFRRAIERSQRLEALVAERTAELDQKNTLIESQARALEESLKARTLFFANISHEFRTPLTLIQAAIDEWTPTDPEAQPKRLAKRYLQRLARLVDQLLDLSKLRLTGVECAAQPWSLNAVVKASVHGFAYLASQRGVELLFEAQRGYDTMVDQASVEKILLNLLSNALKYTPDGGRVTVWLDGDDSTNEVILAVRDTGPGIAPDQQALIFERFERVASEETLRREGAGIGLALVREAASAMGGSVGLSSEIGKGSEFVVRLPGQPVDGASDSAHRAVFLSDQRLALDQAILDEDKSGGQIECMDVAHPSGQDSGRPRLLMVEDNRDLRAYLNGFLKAEWQVFEAEDGEAALEVLDSEDIDVILSDLMMPKMDGLALLASIRDNLETSHIPFLMLSARHDTEAKVSGLTLRADDFLTKPFSPEELKLKLGNMLATRERIRAFWSQQVLAEQAQPSDSPAEMRDHTKRDLSPRDHKFLDKLNRWMEAHYADGELSVEAMAEQLSVNERTLQRKVRALMGLTPLQYLTAYRLDHATRQLMDRSQTLAEVSFDCGFASQSAFSRAFKQKFGLTPSQWREQHG